jgi:hypothetical protein
MDLVVYTVGAISGLPYEECAQQFNKRIEKLKNFGYSVLYPLLGKGYLRNELKLRAEGYENQPLSTNHSITRTDFWRVDKADILYVDFTNAVDRVSIGSVAEMSRGYAQNKLIVTVMQKQNIHRHAFVLEMSSVVFETTDEAEAYLEKYKELMEIN